MAGLSEAQLKLNRGIWASAVGRIGGYNRIGLVRSVNKRIQQGRACVLFPYIRNCLLAALMLFWTDLSTDGILEGKAIIYFSGVLGIHPYKLVYRTAYDYTPYLSALL